MRRAGGRLAMRAWSRSAAESVGLGVERGGLARLLAVLAAALAVVGSVGGARARVHEAQAGGRGNSFAEVVGPVTVKDVRAGVLQVPFITWGGDVATFVANGGLETAAGSIYQGHGLSLKLVNGDDFPAQVRRYMSGESAFLRGELRMLALASEVIGSDPRTKPVVFLQLTWSAGDHMVARAGVRTLNDLKGRRIALQRNGPHVGMLDDVLRNLQLTWADVTVVWTEKLTGEGGPAELFRKDPGLDACFVISPDMIGLTGGLDSKGSGAEGTVKDARVVVSTAQMSRAIADVYAVRKDFYEQNRAAVEKFAAGYLKATERVVGLRNDFAKTGKNAEYMKVLKLAQDILGKEVLPTLEVDAHGLLLDATFVGLPGNRAWFTEKGALDGFEAKQKSALDLAVGQGYARIRAGLIAHDMDFGKLAQLGGLTITEGAGGQRFKAEAATAIDIDALDENTLFSFVINFEPDQATFSQDVYGPEFLRAVQAASTFGSAVVAIRGHADPTLVLREFVQAGMERGVLKREGQPGAFRYFLRGKPFELASTEEIVKLVQGGALDGAKADPRMTLQATMNLSRLRAEAVRDAVVEFASGQGFRLDKSQIQPVGVGASDPVVAVPRTEEDQRRNRRVEFRVVRVPAESVKPGDFDY